MSNRLDFRRYRLAGAALLIILAFAAVPVAARASAVNLGTVEPFVVLGGAAVTNTGPSVLNGDLGVSPGTSLTGFGLPAVVNGATHGNDGVAAQAQSDLTTAFNVAAGQPVPPGNELTGTDLGSRTLTAGAYGFSSSAQLTGQLTLDAQGDPSAQFVFVIGSTLTTASASSVILVNGASPCNVYWKIGSSATLGTSTTFVGNLMALSDISLNNGASVLGRVLARNGQVTLINNVLNNAGCATAGGGGEPSPVGGGEPSPTSGGESSPAGDDAPSTDTGPAAAVRRRAAVRRVAVRRRAAARRAQKRGTAILRRGRKSAAGIRATVRGQRIRRVTFTLGGSRIGGPRYPRRVRVPVTPGLHVVVARVAFTDATPSKTMRFRFRGRTQLLNPRRGVSQFTG